jgi:hypothetical protein
MGFSSPSALTDNESPRLSDTSFELAESFLARPESLVRYLLAGPTLPTTVPLSGFLNLSATLLLSLSPYRFQAGDTHGVCPSRDLFLSRSL